LMQELYLGNQKAISPQVLKQWIERVDSKYVGDSQHDSQELLG
jgi:ubiquitin C-terminal hydrolase